MLTLMRSGIVAVVMAAAVSLTPSESRAGCRLWDCLFGTPSVPSQTTYAPAYVAPPVAAPQYAMPAYAPATISPTCAPTYVSTPTCAPTCIPMCPTYVEPSCGTCVPQVCQYTPTVVQYAPTVAQVTPVVAYRPVYGWRYPTRLVPYSTYRMTYVPAVPYVAYRPVAAIASPCTTCSTSFASCASPLGACSTGCGLSSYGASSCGTPTSGCSSCAAAPASTTTYGTSSEPSGNIAAPSGNLPTPALPKTFEDKKPATDQPPASGPQLAPTPATPQPNIQPIPQQEPSAAAPSGTKLTPVSAPQLADPHDRTAARPVRQAAHVELIGLPVQRNTMPENAGWRAAKD